MVGHTSEVLLNTIRTQRVSRSSRGRDCGLVFPERDTVVDTCHPYKCLVK